MCEHVSHDTMLQICRRAAQFSVQKFWWSCSLYSQVDKDVLHSSQLNGPGALVLFIRRLIKTWSWTRAGNAVRYRVRH